MKGDLDHFEHGMKSLVLEGRFQIFLEIATWPSEDLQRIVQKDKTSSKRQFPGYLGHARGARMLWAYLLQGMQKSIFDSTICQILKQII